ncbi:uncharacterized protein MELLADRAFT_115877 [Melampsora larici-populina 98AG31]|uniref:WD repeat-containing protein 75 second beta-propeller domain-containing protein n=1 Tax=Melampsora larici-populina (strain 98AG31 / pathotype 3-4-7) TaxID=747676 RepID=F4RFA9_MELLP|nr:uncharacterized protein MELLADRAFT_115877 [Melampsora larici-populina 98AG31]EGG08781.1 hypothetical protein MELLADRAFT_115877 [Melampsora larici-populina 98AG31]
MNLQTLLQPPHSACQSLLSEDTGYCFVPGVPLSIHTYSTSNSVLLSTFDLPTSSDATRLINIHKHPQFPNNQLILVASDGTIYIFDFVKSSLLATYHTRRPLIFSSLRISPLSNTSSTTQSVEPPTSFTLLVVTKKTLDPASLNSSKTISHSTRTRRKKMLSTLYAIQLNPLEKDEKKTSTTTEGTFRIIKILNTGRATCYSSSLCGNWVGIVTGLSIWVIRFLQPNLFEFSSKQTKEIGYQVVHLQAAELITSIAFPPRSHAYHFSSMGASSTDVSCTPCDFFATGSITGRIALWHALSEAQWATFIRKATQSPSAILPCPTSISHWHAHAVADLAFTRNGSYLISGGEEAVLVLWKLEDFEGIGHDSKTFLPRLKSPIINLNLIEKLSTNEPGVLVTLEDRSILLVSTSTMTVMKSLCLPKMHQLPSHKTNQACIITCLSPPIGSKPDPLRPYNNIMLLSTHPTTLQVLDGGSGDMLNEVHVLPKNTVSRRDERPTVEPILKFVALGGQGDRFMATINVWHDVQRGFEPEITLKLWERDSENHNDFKLIGRVDNPHEEEITSLNITSAVSPSVVTTSLDGTIKLWTSTNADPVLKPTASKTNSFEWLKSTCLSYRDLKALDSTFSEDGTVMAVLHPQCVSIWDVLGHRLIKTIGSGSTSRLGEYKRVKFVGSTMDKLMIMGSSGLGIYELTSSNEIGFWSSSVHLAVRIPHSDYIVTFEKTITKSTQEEEEITSKPDRQHTLTVIDVSSMKPLFSIKVRPTRAATFVSKPSTPKPDWKPTKEELLDGLILLTNHSGLLRFGKDVFDQYAAAAAAKSLESDLTIKSHLPFKDLLSQPEENEFEELLTTTNTLISNQPNADLIEMFETILKMPPHLIPPTRMIWNKLLVPTPISNSKVASDHKKSSDKIEEGKNDPDLRIENEERIGIPLPSVGQTLDINQIPIPSTGMKPITVEELQTTIPISFK